MAELKSCCRIDFEGLVMGFFLGSEQYVEHMRGERCEQL